MIEQITKGIKITVSTNFEGKRYQNLRMYYAFSYSITIENQSSDTVQLVGRHWNIFDSLCDLETVDGEGVVGEKPIISPKQSYTSPQSFPFQLQCRFQPPPHLELPSNLRSSSPPCWRR